MKVSVIHTGYFKLDGGAMFGIVPRSMWAKLHAPDENNLCTWAMRTLLIETDDGKKFLIDTGLGNKQDEKWRSRVAPFGEETLLTSLAAQNIQPQDITDVILTHLHFDHCGGALSLDENGEAVPTFPNATYWSNQTHWDWAMQPNAREAASFLKENFVPLQTLSKVKMIPVENDFPLFPNLRIQFTYGHTEAMMMIFITKGDKEIIFTADTMPSRFHIPMPYVMAYDIRPLETLKDKQKLLNYAAERPETYLFFEHDPQFAFGTVQKNERGQIVLYQTLETLDF